MKDVLEEGGGSLKPLSVLALAATIIMSIAILYNAVLGQEPANGRPRFVASQITPSGASTRVDVIASELSQKTVVLKYDPRIEEIQRGLLTTGDYKGLVDGVAGNRTRLAIESYQRKAGLAVDGKITPQLVEHIRFRQRVADASEFTASVTQSDADRAEAAVIRQIQTALDELGYRPGEISGALTVSTRQAITLFQRDRGLAQDGAVSDALVAELAKMSGDSSVAAQ
jgi:peptidoglycan hydrolase-like protein with peptidoglycan-binding domain